MTPCHISALIITKPQGTELTLECADRKFLNWSPFTKLGPHLVPILASETGNLKPLSDYQMIIRLSDRRADYQMNFCPRNTKVIQMM